MNKNKIARHVKPIQGNNISASESLPTHVAKQWGFPLQTQLVDGIEFYCAKDWITGLTGAQGVQASRILWKYKFRYGKYGTPSLKGRGWKTLPYEAKSGRNVPQTYTDDEGLYKIAMTLQTKERTSLRAIKDFLAKSGVFVDEARRDPEKASEMLAISRRQQAFRAGKTEEWVATREQSVITRKQFVKAISDLVENKQTFGMIIGSITNDVYRGVFADDVKGLRRRLGLTAKQSPRDNMSRISLAYTTIAEESIQIRLNDYSDHDFLPVPVIREIVQALSEGVGVQANIIANALQIDLLTGRKLIDGPPLTQGQFEGLLKKASQPIEQSTQAVEPSKPQT